MSKSFFKLIFLLYFFFCVQPVFSKEINLFCISEMDNSAQWQVFIDTDKLLVSTQIRAGNVTRKLNIGSSEYWFNLVGDSTFVIDRRNIRFEIRNPIAFTGIMQYGNCRVFESKNKI